MLLRRKESCARMIPMTRTENQRSASLKPFVSKFEIWAGWGGLEPVTCRTFQTFTLPLKYRVRVGVRVGSAVGSISNFDLISRNFLKKRVNVEGKKIKNSDHCSACDHGVSHLTTRLHFFLG